MVLFVTKLFPGVSATELPVDLYSGTIHLLIPGKRLSLERGQIGNPPFAQTLPSEQADFDLGLVKPTAVLGCIVHGEAVPKGTALLFSVIGGERLSAVSVQVIHYQVNRPSARISARQRTDGCRQLWG